MRTSWLIAGLLAALAPALSRSSAAVQTTEADLFAFEVVSVKPNRSGSADSRVSMPPGRLMVTNLPLGALIEFAYGLSMLAAPPGAVPMGRLDAVIGGPAWLQTERFDIDAVAGGTPTREQMLSMVRRLLADRFRLVAHTESRERPVLALVVARPDGRLGPRLHLSDGACRSRSDRIADATRVEPQPFCGVSFMAGGVTGGAVTMAQLASTLSRQLPADVRRTVVDQTGLSGTFDLTLEFTQTSTGGMQPGRGPAAGRGSSAAPGGVREPDPFATDIFMAVQEQLGLELKPGTGTAGVLVIDAVQRPTEN
jgi:uncharacterized protein (TIGR03435 family)